MGRQEEGLKTSRPGRIIHIIRVPDIGGSEMLVKNILNANNDQDFSHSLLYTVNGPLLSMINKDKKSHLIHCKYINPLFFIFRLKQTIKNQKPDLIHTHQPVDAIYALLATIGDRVKIVRTYHGYEGIYRNKPGFSFKSKIIYFFINRFICLNLFVSGALMDYYRSINPAQSHTRQRILYNGINPEDLKKSNATGLRSELGISNESILMGMTGGFNTKGRDHFTICKALKSVLELYPRIHFLFIGKKAGNSPVLFDKCYRFCEKNKMLENVHFIGERNNIGDILGELKLYIHSSNNETFGIALVEAMFARVPIVASDIPPFREVSENGENITLFEKGNVDDLYNKLVLELKNIDSVKTKERIRKAKGFAEKSFSIEVHIENLHKLYHECLK
jgi:glycosyltransferase involved in cell wall biosynthesis